MLWPGLEECVWSTSDYSVEVTARKLPVCATFKCVYVQYIDVYVFPGAKSVFDGVYTDAKLYKHVWYLSSVCFSARHTANPEKMV